MSAVPLVSVKVFAAVQNLRQPEDGSLMSRSSRRQG